MAINNGIGRVWAANAGDEGRPAGVGPVWIENIDALIPSGDSGHTYTGVNGIEVDNDNDTISLDDEAQAAIDSYVTNSASFLTDEDLNGYATETYVTNEIESATSAFVTSADLPEVPEIKDLVAGNGINISATSADVTISVDNAIFNGYATETWVQSQDYVDDTEMSEYVTSATSAFVTSGDIPEVPGVKDLIAGNGINITTTSADVTIAAKVDGSTIKFDGSGNLSTDIAGVPTTSGASSGYVLTYNGSSVGWAAPQGGGGGGSLPPIADNTVRCRFTSGYTPTMGADGNVCVDAANNIWDITDNNSWANKFQSNANLLEVLGCRLISTSSRSLAGMFKQCTNLYKATNLVVSTDNLSYSPYSAYLMFTGCDKLVIVEFDVIEIDNASNMFDSCLLLQEFRAPDLSYITNASYMFNDCRQLRYVSTASLAPTSVEHMYHGCTNLIFAGSKISLYGIYNSSYMFFGCSSLTTIPEIEVDTEGTANANISYMFEGCKNAVAGIKEAYESLTYIGSTVTDCFTGCGTSSYSGRQDRLQIPAAWGGDGA